MRNSFGHSVTVTLFGESHGPYIGAVLDGVAPGIPVDEAFIAAQLSLRRPAGAISTARQEPDPFVIASGVFEGKTIGAPITLIIPNSDTRSRDYTSTRALARPGHADYTAWVKYHGFEDYRGGGHFSGRITAALVAAGAIAISALRRKGILIGTHISRCAGIDDDPWTDLPNQVNAVNQRVFAVINVEKGARMQEAIRQAAEEEDSVGGILETAVLGFPAGVGEPWFDGVESALSRALFGIPAVKGVEFGDGFAMSDRHGSETNDEFCLREGRVETRTNHNGGINGGISNGMPLVFRCAVKPTPSIARTQQTVDLIQGKEAELRIQGRHDPAIVHRARAVVDSVTALVLCDLLALRFGTDYLGGDEE